MIYQQFLKRFLDIIASLFALVLFSPILILLVIIFCFINNGKPFFLQERPGLKGKIFKIIKFKTMRDLDENTENDVHSVSRITKVGSFVRKYSLDELLQFINVFKGDMGLIGPRPLLTEYMPLYNTIQQKRHDVRPGITGWAQVKGRNSISWNKKFEYDVWYVENCSFLLDLKIFWLTILKIFKSEGINSDEGDVTMEVWKGNI